MAGLNLVFLVALITLHYYSGWFN